MPLPTSAIFRLRATPSAGRARPLEWRSLSIGYAMLTPTRLDLAGVELPELEQALARSGRTRGSTPGRSFSGSTARRHRLRAHDAISSRELARARWPHDFASRRRRSPPRAIDRRHRQVPAPARPTASYRVRLHPEHPRLRRTRPRPSASRRRSGARCVRVLPDRARWGSTGICRPERSSGRFACSCRELDCSITASTSCSWAWASRCTTTTRR